MREGAVCGGDLIRRTAATSAASALDPDPLEGLLPRPTPFMLSARPAARPDDATCSLPLPPAEEEEGEEEEDCECLAVLSIDGRLVLTADLPAPTTFASLPLGS